MGNQKEQHLFGNAPTLKKSETLPGNAMLQWCYDVIENHNLKHVALDDCVPNQINPKTIPEKRQALAVGR